MDHNKYYNHPSKQFKKKKFKNKKTEIKTKHKLNIKRNISGVYKLQ